MAKKALLVGINRYKIPGADLRGCVNDVKNLRVVLTAYYGFAGKDIKTLTDYAATTKAMRNAVATLVKGAKKGDVLLFHYSGHGANVPDKNGDDNICVKTTALGPCQVPVNERFGAGPPSPSGNPGGTSVA